MELNKKNMRKLMLLIAFGLVVYFGLLNLRSIPSYFGLAVHIISPIVLGFVMAYIFNILMRVIEVRAFAPLNRRFVKTWPKLRRVVSILVSLLIIIGMIALIVVIILPDLIKTVTGLSNNIPSYFNQLQLSIKQFYGHHPLLQKQLGNIRIDWSSISQLLLQYAQQFTKNLVGYTITLTTNVFNGFVTFILGFVIAINILFQKETLKKQVKRLLFAYLPQDYPHKVLKVCRLTNQAFSDFIAGQCWGAVILGVLCYVGMMAFRFPFALLISVFVAVLSFVPILGQILGVIVGALLILTVSPIQALWFIVYLNVLQQLNGNLIYPKIVGSKMDLPALWVLIAITIGGNTFGLVGMLVSIPIFSVIHILLRENIRRRLDKPRRCGPRAE